MAISETIQLGMIGAGTLLVALLACENKIDDKKLTDGIKDLIEEKLELDVKDVDCPKDIEAKAGEEFECEVTVKPKGKIPVNVEIKDNEGNIWAEVKHPVFNPEKFKKDNDIECPEKVLVVKKDKTLECKAKDGSAVEVKIDDEGNIKWKSK